MAMHGYLALSLGLDSSTKKHFYVSVRKFLITGFCHRSLGTMCVAKEMLVVTMEVAKQEMKHVLTVNRK